MNIFQRIRRAFTTEPPYQTQKRSTKDPIYIEYYTHAGCDCYKIDLPFTAYRKETLVLSTVSEGKAKAIRMARKAILEQFDVAVHEE